MMDENNETKHLAIFVIVFKEDSGAKTRILNVPAVPGGTAQEIFNAIESVLRLVGMFSH